MPEVQFVSGVIVALGLLLALARLTGLPPSVVVFAGGLASALLPVPLPPLRTNPEVVLGLLLPPLLYAGVVALSVDLLRHALVRGVLAGAALVIGITLTVALAAHALLPSGRDRRCDTARSGPCSDAARSYGEDWRADLTTRGRAASFMLGSCPTLST